MQEQAAEVGLPPDLTASTLHRLLGWRPDSRSRFRHDAGNHLPYDVVVVDESSMVSLTMMARLLEALRPGARLVLVGDPDQLTPVEAGAVLSDLVHRPAPRRRARPACRASPAGDLDLDDEEQRQLRNGVVRLRVPHRYGAGIGRARRGRPRRRRRRGARAARVPAAGCRSRTTSTGCARRSSRSPGALRAAATAGDARRRRSPLLGRHRLLCAHRHGPYGVSHWNDQVGPLDRGRRAAEWHPGQPLLVTANDHENRLYNGDTRRRGRAPRTACGRPSRAAGGPELLPLSRLSSVQTAHALTVHRSQGSQYDAVTRAAARPRPRPLLTRELLYTAVTRGAGSGCGCWAPRSGVRAGRPARSSAPAGCAARPGTSPAAVQRDARPPG